MSLINDALKKAQKQRTGEAPDLNKLPSIGGEAPARIAKRDKPPAFNSLVLWVSAGAATVLVLAVGGFFLIRWMMRPSEAQSSAVAPAKQTMVAQGTPVAKETPAPALVQTSVPSTTAPTPAVVTGKPAVPEVAVGAKPVEVAPAAATPMPVEETKSVAPAAAAKIGPKAVAFIDALRIAGVRASGVDGKAIMNDRVYRIGDTVEHVLGLKLAAITAESLTFEDENGARYTRKL